MARIVILMLFFISMGFAIHAQQPGSGRRGFDPHQMAERQTASMIDVLMLSEAQAQKIREVNLKYAQRMDSLRSAGQGDFEGMRDQMAVLFDQQANEQKIYLTGEQFEKWQKYRQERRKDRSQRRRPGSKDQVDPNGN